MWVMMSDSFLSIVKDTKGRPNEMLLVRARKREDILAVFPNARVIHTPKADYHWRVRMDRDVVAGALFDRVTAIEYGNFKNSVPDDERHDAYLSIWGTMQSWARGFYATKRGQLKLKDNWY